MSELQLPLTPPDCDLRDFAFMPLDVARLRDSDLVALETPEAFRAAVLLWCASWHQVPAASLPDDDRVLSKLAGYGYVVREWLNHKDGALRGWIKCADGRLYHPIVAEKANESWFKKVHYGWEKECERIRKANKKRQSEGHAELPYPPEPTMVSIGIPPERTGIPPEKVKIPPERKPGSAGNDESSAGNTLAADGSSAGIPPENALKGEGEGQGQGQGEGQGEGELKNKDQHLDGATAGGKTGERAEMIPKRNVQIAVLLRANGIDTATSQHPTICLDWSLNIGVTDEILLAAVKIAKDAKPDERIPINYLKPIVEQLLNPPEAKSKPKDDWSWKRSDEGVTRKGRELGMHPRGTESYRDYADRIEAEILNRKGKAA